MSTEFTKTQKRTPRSSQRGRARKPGARPLTLPALRARETRQRILDAARTVFTREGYGQAAVEAIVVEAGISRGAFYHHFAGKEELLRVLLDDHLRGEMMELRELGRGWSVREIIEAVVAYQIEHLRSHLKGDLSLEFWAEAAREEWVRDLVADFHRRARDGFATMLRLGQATGAIRSDLNSEAAATLLLALFEGVSVLQMLDPDEFAAEQLSEEWASLIERLILTQGGGDIEAFRVLFSGSTEGVLAPATEDDA